MNKTCNTCQHRNAQGICTNHDSVFFGSRVDDGTCPVWENYDKEMSVSVIPAPPVWTVAMVIQVRVKEGRVQWVQTFDSVEAVQRCFGK